MHEKEFQIMKRGSQVYKPGKNDENGNISATMHPNYKFLTGNSMSGPGGGPEMGPGTRNAENIFLKIGFSWLS